MNPARPAPFLPAPALLLAAASGAAGLAHQLLWMRRLVDILGADAGTFSRVIAALQQNLPAALRHNPAADWSAWPMRFAPALP